MSCFDLGLVTCILYTYAPKFSSILILRVQRTFTCLWYTIVPNFSSLAKFWMCKEHPCSLSPDLELWSVLEVPDWGFASWYWLGYGNVALKHSRYKCLSILILKVQRTIMYFKSWFETLEDSGGSWLGFYILILISIWSLVFGMPLFQVLGLYLDFEGAKNIYVL